jgi:chorismate dehydratase
MRPAVADEPGVNMHSKCDKRDGWRIGAVSFLNTKPLIWGLDQRDDVSLLLDVPSGLPARLASGQVDAALVPVIDLAEPHHQWKVVSDACIAADGDTLTVRVFSRVPPARIERLWVDGDSHTSVVLARLLWRELYGIDLETRPLPARAQQAEAEAVLLIGDKVVAGAPEGFPHRVDLGSAWRALTGLPFVFAVWAAPRDLPTDTLARLLAEARDHGCGQAGRIADAEGPRRGWPPGKAREYLMSKLRFTLGMRERMGLSRFFKMAGCGDVAARHRELLPA